MGYIPPSVARLSSNMGTSRDRRLPRATSMIWRTTFVALLFASILIACGDRERVNCPEVRTKNKALRAETSITVDTASLGSTRILADKCL
jgi:hypothetical protein